MRSADAPEGMDSVTSLAETVTRERDRLQEENAMLLRECSKTRAELVSEQQRMVDLETGYIEIIQGLDATQAEGRIGEALAVLHAHPCAADLEGVCQICEASDVLKGLGSAGAALRLIEQRRFLAEQNEALQSDLNGTEAALFEARRGCKRLRLEKLEEARKVARLEAELAHERYKAGQKFLENLGRIYERDEAEHAREVAELARDAMGQELLRIGRQLEANDAAYAAMRDTLIDAREALIYARPETSGEILGMCHVACERIDAALATDAGKGWVSPARAADAAEKLETAHIRLLDECSIANLPEEEGGSDAGPVLVWVAELVRQALCIMLARCEECGCKPHGPRRDGCPCHTCAAHPEGTKQEEV